MISKVQCSDQTRSLEHFVIVQVEIKRQAASYADIHVHFTTIKKLTEILNKTNPYIFDRTLVNWIHIVQPANTKEM